MKVGTADTALPIGGVSEPALQKKWDCPLPAPALKCARERTRPSARIEAP